jgi:hypothetical protein
MGRVVPHWDDLRGPVVIAGRRVMSRSDLQVPPAVQAQTERLMERLASAEESNRKQAAEIRDLMASLHQVGGIHFFDILMCILRSYILRF